MRKVLLLCASHNDLGTIRALRKMGCYIIATGNKENLPGQKWVDKYIKADYSDKEMMLKIATEEKIDNIIACCNDFGVYSAAYVAEKLGLDGYDNYENTLILNNKDRFRLFAKENNLMSLDACCFEDRHVAFNEIRTMKLPVIVKPVDCSAGNGISVVREVDDISFAVGYAFDSSKASRIVVEPFLDGTQHGFCTFLVNQKVCAVCTNNEYSFINPFRVEIDTFPATDYQKYQELIIEQIEKIASLLNLKDGIFHLQYIVCNGKPWILEVMRRTIGNMYHVLGNPLNGIEWEYWETRARLGLDCNSFPKNIVQEGCFAYKSIMGTKNGFIKNIIIPKEYEKYIFNQILLMNLGDEITNYLSQPVGIIFMMFNSEAEMYDVLIKNYRNDLVLVE